MKKEAEDRKTSFLCIHVGVQGQKDKKSAAVKGFVTLSITLLKPNGTYRNKKFKATVWKKGHYHSGKITYYFELHGKKKARRGLKKHGIKTKITPSYDYHKMLEKGKLLWNIKQDEDEEIRNRQIDRERKRGQHFHTEQKHQL